MKQKVSKPSDHKTYSFISIQLVKIIPTAINKIYQNDLELISNITIVSL